MSSIDQLLQTLSEAPDSQIDASITPRIKSLVGVNDEIVASELKTILDECAVSSLASDFAMNVLHQAWISVKTGDTK